MEPKDAGRLLEAFDAYYALFGSGVYNRIYSQLAPYGDEMKQKVEDLFQDIFISAWNWMNGFWERTNQIPSREIFKRALYKMELKSNDYIKRHIRKAQREAALEEAADGDAPDRGRSARIEPMALGANPEQQLLWDECMDQLERCLQTLRTRDRSAILYHAIGYSDKEVAALIDADASTVTHSIIPQAKKKLSRCMEGYIHGKRS